MALRRTPARGTTGLTCCPCTSCCACPRAETPGPLRARQRASGRESERAAAARCGGRRTLAALPVDGLHVLALAQLVADVGQRLCGRGHCSQAKRSEQALGATRRDVARARGAAPSASSRPSSRVSSAASAVMASRPPAQAQKRRYKRGEGHDDDRKRPPVPTGRVVVALHLSRRARGAHAQLHNRDFGAGVAATPAARYNARARSATSSGFSSGPR